MASFVAKMVRCVLFFHLVIIPNTLLNMLACGPTQDIVGGICSTQAASVQPVSAKSITWIAAPIIIGAVIILVGLFIYFLWKYRNPSYRRMKSMFKRAPPSDPRVVDLMEENERLRHQLMALNRPQSETKQPSLHAADSRKGFKAALDQDDDSFSQPGVAPPLPITLPTLPLSLPSVASLPKIRRAGQSFALPSPVDLSSQRPSFDLFAMPRSSVDITSQPISPNSSTV